MKEELFCQAPMKEKFCCLVPVKEESPNMALLKVSCCLDRVKEEYCYLDSVVEESVAECVIYRGTDLSTDKAAGGVHLLGGKTLPPESK